MQDIEKQANKNGVALVKHGRCQFCGSNTREGVFECFRKYNDLSGMVKFNNIQHFLWADSHALQHSEIHGKWNSNLHLTRQYLILKKNIKWDYEKTPLLSSTIDLYKTINEKK